MEMASIYYHYIIPGSVLVPLCTYLSGNKKYSQALNVLFLYLVFSCLINVWGIVLARNHQPNLWLLHIYTVIESVSLLLFFLFIDPSAKTKKIITALLFLFPMACVANSFFLESIKAFNSYARSVEALLFIFLSFHYWLHSNKITSDRWSSNPYNWIVSGIILYFSSSFFLFVFSNVILVNAPKKATLSLSNHISSLWYVHGTLVIIQYILFSVGFSKVKKCRKIYTY